MKTSIRTVMAITLTAAMIAGVLSSASGNRPTADPYFGLFQGLTLSLLATLAFCLSGASIAYDRNKTLRSAARGALNALYVWLIVGVLVQFLLMSPVR